MHEDGSEGMSQTHHVHGPHVHGATTPCRGPVVSFRVGTRSRSDTLFSHNPPVGQAKGIDIHTLVTIGCSFASRLRS